jgi:serine/threonine-protein kinase
MEQDIEHYLNLTSLDCNQPDLTLGRSSILLGLTLLAEAAGPKALEMLGPQGDALLEGIWRKLDEEPAIRESKNLSYLGMAHGWAGTIYAALRWARLTGTPPYSSLGVRLDQLADLAVPTSKGVLWPVQNRETGGFPMPGWCNGGAGHVFLWTLAHRLFSRERFLKLAIGAAEESALSGGGGHSLCCGWAGQAYALLALYNHTGEKRWLEHARTLASRALAFAQCRQPGLPYSLYKGDLGVAVLLAEIQLPEIASMPFFDEEGWT